MAAEEVTGGATSWKVLFFPCLCLSPTILNDLLLNESALTALNTLPELRCQKLSIEIKTNLISLEIAAAVKKMSRF